jgi:RNA polymerase sigma factor (sigma-70 family)
LDHSQPFSVDDITAHGRFVRDLARRLLAEDSHAAEDLAQDVWSTALQRPPPHRNSLKGWLRAVALALNANRLRRRALQREEGLDGHARTEPFSAEQLDLATQRRAVARAVNDLHEPYRSVVLLRFWEGLPPRDVARRLGRPVETINTQTKRALAQLRQALQKDRKSDYRTWLFLLAARPAGHRFERMALPTAFAGAAGIFVALQLALPDPQPPLAPDASAPLAAVAPALHEPALPGARETAAHTLPLGTAELPPIVSSASEASRPQRRLSALIEDGQGHPIPGASLFVLHEEGWAERGRADERGEVEVDIAPEELGVRVAPPGFVWVKAQAEGWATTHEALRDFGAQDRASVQLDLAPGGATLRGQVVDRDSIPVPDARVLLLPSNLPTGTNEAGLSRRVARHETRSDEDGSFELAHLAQGPSQVYLLHPDLGIGRCEVRVAADAPLAELRFAPGCIVHGTVTDEKGAPVAGCKVSGIDPELAPLPSSWIEATTDAAGHYVLAMSASPRLELWANGRGVNEMMASQIVDARAGAELEWNARLKHWPPVNVRVVDAAGKPLADWFVSLFSERQGETRWNAARTDARGEAQMVLPVEGSLTVRVHGPFSGHRDTTVAALRGVSASDTDVYEIAVEPERSQTSGVIARLAAPDWTLPADLLVSFEQEGHSNRVRVGLGADSSARADDLAPGRYRVFALAPPALQSEIAVAELGAGQVVDLGTLAVDPPGGLDLSRLAADASFEVWLEPKEGEPRFCWRGAGGAAQPLALFPGHYALLRASEGSNPTPLRFEMLSRGLVVIDAEFNVR